MREKTGTEDKQGGVRVGVRVGSGLGQGEVRVRVKGPSALLRSTKCV